MKEVIKVSLAGVSFTIEKEAYREIENYLSELKRYYDNEPGRDEIIEDIEERIAELLIEKGCKERIVTFGDVNCVIDILGRPYVNQDVNMIGNPPKKRLYRDLDNAIVGGVCSGFAAYLNMDPVWARIIYILFFFFLASPFYFIRSFIGFGGMSGFTFSVLVYCVLWIIIPSAKTITQKCAMRGVSPGVDEIKNRVKDGVSSFGNELNNLGKKSASGLGNIIGRAIKLFFGIILFIISIGGLISGFVLFLGAKWFDNISLLGAVDYVNFNVDFFWLKIFGLLCFFLPFIGILYLSIKLIIGFKSPKWKPGVILFLLWITSLFTFAVMCAIGAKPYYNKDKLYDNISFKKNYDTLVVKFPSYKVSPTIKMYADADKDDVDLMFLKKDGEGYEYVTYPKLRVYRDSTISTPYITYTHSFYTGLNAFSDYELKMTKENIININDSLLTIYPMVYSKINKYGGEKGSIKLYVPYAATVILEEPFQHVFAKGSKFRSTINSKTWWFGY